MEQLRTEAEKFYKEYVKDKGQGAITLNVIDIMMAFHAQQTEPASMEKVKEALIYSKTAIQHCIDNDISVLFCKETLEKINDCLNTQHP